MALNPSPTLAQVTKELLASYNRLPRKGLGQHFLIDPQVLQRIIAAAELNSQDTVVEIGSGLGIVTSEIAKHAGRVIAIEIDKELLSISKEVLKTFQNITFIPGDVLKVAFDFPAPYKIIGNLPYYITAPITEKILKAEHKPSLAVLMVQKEVAERIAAAPGSKQYGSFSIFTQFYAAVEINSLVSKSSFLPWPEVSSAIISLVPHATPRYVVKDEKRFFDIVHAAFQQRRKQLKNSLAKYHLEGAGIDLSRRPETLSIEEFVTLSNA